MRAVRTGVIAPENAFGPTINAYGPAKCSLQSERRNGNILTANFGPMQDYFSRQLTSKARKERRRYSQMKTFTT